jgi:NitT/TauT family transport system substrate-binding protein
MATVFYFSKGHSAVKRELNLSAMVTYRVCKNRNPLKKLCDFQKAQNFCGNPWPSRLSFKSMKNFPSFSLKTIIRPFFLIILLLIRGGNPVLALGEKSLTPIQLTLNWKPEPQFGGFYQIKTDRLDESRGFNLEITPGGSGTPTVQMLLSKKVDFAIVSADEIVLAHMRGQTQIKAVFATFQLNPQMIMVKTDPKITSLIDLIQRSDYTLQWQSGLPYAQFIKKKFSSQFKIKQAPYLGGVGLFLKESKLAQQGFETSEPLILPSNLSITIFKVRDIGFNPYTTVVAVHEDFLKSKPQMVKSVTQMFQEGWLKYLKDPQKANQFMLKSNPFQSLELFSKGADLQKSLIWPSGDPKLLGKMELPRWQALLDQMREAGLGDKSATKADLKASDFYADLL